MIDNTIGIKLAYLCIHQTQTILNYIKLGKPSDMVTNTILNEIYLSKHLRLSEVLHYYDLAGIAACVTMDGNIVSKRLHTHISITCADAEFKLMLSGAIDGYNA